MSVTLNKQISAAANLIALVAASNAAFASANWQPQYLVFSDTQVLTGTADGANTSVNLGPQTDLTVTAGVLIRGPVETITYARSDVATLLGVDVSALAYTLNPSADVVVPTDVSQPIAFKDDATVLTSLLTSLFGAPALASEFTLSYVAAGNAAPLSGATSAVSITVAPMALIFDPATAPINVTLTWPVEQSTDEITTTAVGSFSPVAPDPAPVVTPAVDPTASTDTSGTTTDTSGTTDASTTTDTTDAGTGTADAGTTDASTTGDAGTVATDPNAAAQ
jgi:hypothetical protein